MQISNLNIVYHRFLLLLTVGTFSYVQAQEVPRRIPTPEDYSQWTMVNTQMMDASGEWLLYRLSGALSDTLFAQSTVGKKRYTFPEAKKGLFVKDTHLVVQLSEEVYLIDLKKDKKQTFRNVDQFDVAGTSLVFLLSTGNAKTLELRSCSGALLYSVANASSYKINPKTSDVVVIIEKQGQSKLIVLHRKGNHFVELPVKKQFTRIVQLIWSSNGTQLAFLEETSMGMLLYHYNIQSEALTSLQTLQRPLESLRIPAHTAIEFSLDGKQIFFKARYRTALAKNPENAVQVWNAGDKWIYPAEQMVMGFSRSLHLMMWNILTDQYLEITDPKLPKAIVTADAKWAILHNPKTHEPQFKANADVDLSLMELKTGKLSRFLLEQLGSEVQFYPTPEGKNIVYFRKGVWYIYNLELAEHHLLTDVIGISADDKNHSVALGQSVGCAGWTADGKAVLLFDAFDIWEVALNGTRVTQLTHGRQTGSVYRILKAEQTDLGSEYRMAVLPIYDLKNGLLLHGRSADYSTNGLYFWNKGLKNVAVYEDQKKIYGIVRKGKNTAWISESYAIPPQVMVSKAHAKAKTIAVSNKQENHFAPRRLEVITYQSNTGAELRGLLYFPYGFKEGKKYPMITYIYEQQSNAIHEHLLPSNSTSEEGFNVTHYLSKGYFVLLPDIAYETDLAGKSATICVENAVAAALKIAPIDPQKMGLIGHSFGGYETCFIITQSTTFACAVAGSAITDFTSTALSVYRNLKVPNIFRVEESQSRISQSVTQNKEAYIINSPIYYVKQVETPLLSWTGLEDSQVEATQSMELYMAMRRERKKHILLNYPKEGHGLTDIGMIADLTNKIEGWFDHYLKDVPEETWMHPKQ